MAPTLRINAVAYISPQNQPILIRTFNEKNEEAVKYHYIAHTSLDVIEERMAPENKNTECYLGLLYAMEDVAVYGYVTPLKVKIVVAFALSDSVVRDIEVNTIFKALHMAYYHAISNPFLKLDSVTEPLSEKSVYLLAGSPRWKNFRRRVDDATIPAIEVHIPAIETDVCEVNILPFLLTLLLGCDQTDGTILAMMPDEPRASIPFF